MTYKCSYVAFTCVSHLFVRCGDYFCLLMFCEHGESLILEIYSSKQGNREVWAKP